MTTERSREIFPRKVEVADWWDSFVGTTVSEGNLPAAWSRIAGGFGVFLVHPPMASVLLSAMVERCFVSRMRDFFGFFGLLQFFNILDFLDFCY